MALKLHPLGKDKAYFYEVRPYILRNNLNTDNLNIPLILYGSGWVDEKYGFMRFCGEKVKAFNPDSFLNLSNSRCLKLYTLFSGEFGGEVAFLDADGFAISYGFHNDRYLGNDGIQ